MYIPKETNGHKLIVELGPNTLLGLLQIPLICLKLTNAIAYPWWMVVLPSWGIFALGVLVLICKGIIWCIKNTFYFSKQ